MKKPFPLYLITIIVFIGCKKDAPITLYPKTFTQSTINYSYEFKVNDKALNPYPPKEIFFSNDYLISALSELSFTLLNEDSLLLQGPNSSMHLEYEIRNDTIYTKLYPLSNTMSTPYSFVWKPFAIGNLAQLKMIDRFFSYTPVTLQDKPPFNLPVKVPITFSYKDHSFFTDTAALLTVTRVFN